MSEYTPGPWEAKRGKVLKHFVSASGTVVAGMMRGGQAQLDDATLAANCRLIAAAPDLLAALVALRDWYDGTPATSLQDHIPGMRAAINRATGDNQ